MNQQMLFKSVIKYRLGKSDIFGTVFEASTNYSSPTRLGHISAPGI